MNLPPVECIWCCNRYVTLITSSASNELFLLVYSWSNINDSAGNVTFSPILTNESVLFKVCIGSKDTRRWGSLRNHLLLQSNAIREESLESLSIIVAINNMNSTHDNTSTIQAWRIHTSPTSFGIVGNADYESIVIQGTVNCIAHDTCNEIAICESKAKIVIRDALLKHRREIILSSLESLQINSPPINLSFVGFASVCLVLESSHVMVIA